MIKRIIIEFATPDDEGRKTTNHESTQEMLNSKFDRFNDHQTTNHESTQEMLNSKFDFLKTPVDESEKEDHSDESIESIHDEINAMLKLINTLRKRGNDNE